MRENSGVEARRVESRRRGSWRGGKGSRPPSHQLAERYRLPQRVWGAAPAEIEFGAFWP